jgi:nitrogen fixation/metabolism regulation signal transduction histidine kinase
LKIKNSFRIFTLLLLVTLLVLAYFAFRSESSVLFFGMEALILVAFIYLIWLYRRIVKPFYIIGIGTELLQEQDFSSRLTRVNQPEIDRIVDVFNRMMYQLKNERLHLREQNHFLDLLIEASPMGLVMVDLDRRILSVNPAITQILHVRQDEISGKKLAETDEPLLKALERIPLGESTTVRLNDANIYKCTHSSFIDRGFNHSFFLVESLTREVFKAEKKAYEKVIRMISHEVNNTVSGIASTLDAMLADFEQREDMQYVGEVLHVSVERCYSMSRFVTRFADVVRIPEPRLQECDLNALVSASKRFMESLCINRNIELVMEPDKKPVPVMIDISLFEQVLVNIIKNAAESIERDGAIYIRTAGEPAFLEIADTGKGIDRETEARLFTPFFSTKPNGQGIGLVFIREVLQKHRASFSLGTFPDGLTKFRIRFLT